MNELDEKTMLDVLKKLVDNMSHTLKEAETGGEKMFPTWFAVVYYEADQIKVAIDDYFKPKEGSGFEICKAMQEAQIAGLEKEIKAEKKRIVTEREYAEIINGYRHNWLGEVQK